jgi:hypothetical protein
LLEDCRSRLKSEACACLTQPVAFISAEDFSPRGFHWVQLESFRTVAVESRCSTVPVRRARASRVQMHAANVPHLDSESLSQGFLTRSRDGPENAVSYPSCCFLPACLPLRTCLHPESMHAWSMYPPAGLPDRVRRLAGLAGPAIRLTRTDIGALALRLRQRRGDGAEISERASPCDRTAGRGSCHLLASWSGRPGRGPQGP